jgi:hypothetical protein
MGRNRTERTDDLPDAMIAQTIMYKQSDLTGNEKISAEFLQSRKKKKTQ